MRPEAVVFNLPDETVLEAAFEHSYNAMVITDADLDGGPFIRRCNPAFCAMTGYTERELIGQSPRILQGPDTDRTLIDQLDRTIRAGEFFEGSTVNYRKDGGPYVVEWNISPVRDADGAIVAYISIQQDITARFSAEREAEEARVAESEALLRASADSLLDPQVVLEAARDSSGQIVDFLYRDVNQATCDYLGLPREDLIGRGVVEAMPGIKNTLLTEYIKCLETGAPLHLDDFSHDNEGLHDTRRYDLRATRATPTAISVTWRDVTERFHLARRMAESEQNYRLLAENIGDVVSIMRDGKFAWISPSVEGVLGAPPAYWIGREVCDIIPADRMASHAERMQRLAADGIIQERSRVQAVDGRLLWIQLTLKALKDAHGRQNGYTASFRVIDAEVAAEQAVEEARRQQALADARYRRSIDNAAVGMCMVTADGRLQDVNEAMCRLFGYDASAMNGTRWQDFTAPEYLDEELTSFNGILEGRIDFYRIVKHYVHADGHLIWGDLSVSGIRDDNGQLEHMVALITDITAQVQADERNRVLAQQLQRQNDLIRKQARADQRFRRSMDNAAVAMCLVTPEGRFKEVNDAACQFFGVDAQTLTGMSFQDVTPKEYLDAELNNYNDLMEGRIGSYRMLKHYVRADGKPIWGDLSASGIRDEDGRVSEIVGQIIDVTDRVEADERNRILAQQLQEQTDRVKSELDSAATYMSSLMPSGLQGPVTVSSRYLPSRELGGDCLDYYWIDDDHLLITLIDVSGHGLEPALLAVSVHNLMRSGSLPRETLLSPEAVLTELNRLFVMERQSDHYFTMWFGIYEKSTRTLRYVSAGAPPALAFNAATGTAVASTALSTPASPVGVFVDTEFTSRTYQVPPGCRILVYSDGASEINLADGRQLTGAAFEDLTNRVAASSDWSLDDLIGELRALTTSGVFEDDFSLIQLTFD